MGKPKYKGMSFHLRKEGRSHVHTPPPPSTPWMNPEDIMLGEMSWIQKGKYHVIHLQEEPKLGKVTETNDNSNNNAERWVVERGSSLFKGYRSSD